MTEPFTPHNPFEVRSEQVNEQNRKVAYYNGSRVNLAGIFAATAKLDGNFAQILDVLATRKNNFFRHYLTNYWLYNPADPQPTPDGTDQRQRYSPFFWHTKDDPDPNRREKWDLTRFNDDYFARLRLMLLRAQERGIVVQLVLFDGAGMRGGQRWPHNPWNAFSDPPHNVTPNNINGVVQQPASATPAFYTNRDAPAVDGAGNPTTLGAIQDNFVTKVVTETLSFWNVVFEIMNEPTEAQPPVRANWGNTIVNVINCVTRGRRLIFYNDHSHYQAEHREGGADVNAWRGLSHYGALDGVIIHGDPNNVMDTREPAWLFTGEKLIQASSDTHLIEGVPEEEQEREDRAWNKATTTALFRRAVIFQAEASSTNAADGIGQATPPPTKIVRAPFLGDWNKTSTDAPHFHLRFSSSGRYFAISPVEDKVTTQGRLVSFTPTQFVVQPDGQPQQTFNYTLSPDGRVLTYTNVANQRTQTFQRFSGDIQAFLYGWKKIGEREPSAAPRFFLYFRQDGTFVARNPDDPQQIMNQGRVNSIICPQGKMRFDSTTQGTQVEYFFLFTKNGTRLRIARVDNGRWQDFARTFEGLPA
ncbi:MAG TPA: hypothetical protein VF736_05685 [Pyrinomonadaceae bacterium]|jgi:hypothetical protein